MTTPYYADERVTLYLGDCREVTEWLTADVLVTDPPYGIGWKRNGISRVSQRDRDAGNYSRHVRSNPHNDNGILHDDTTQARDVALAMWGNGPGYVFGSLLLPPPPGTKQVAIYGKPKDSGNLTGIGGVRRNVEAIYLVGGHAVGGGGRSAIFQTNAATAGNPTGLASRYGHPHAKPLDVLSDLIKLTTGIIADPFAGSGSTLVAAKALRRQAVGVEIDERYCEIAAKRLAQGVLDFGDGAA